MILQVWGLDGAELAKLRDEIPSENLNDSLVTIHRYLNHLFPQRQVRDVWMLKPNGAFDGRRPVDLILEEKKFGLEKIEKYLAGAMQR